MSVQPALLTGRALERLFAPGIRLGWTFRDRNGMTTPYPEPEPAPRYCASRLPNGPPWQRPGTPERSGG
jgi:hypothetical protein